MSGVQLSGLGLPIVVLRLVLLVRLSNLMDASKQKNSLIEYSTRRSEIFELHVRFKLTYGFYFHDGFKHGLNLFQISRHRFV